MSAIPTLVTVAAAMAAISTKADVISGTELLYVALLWVSTAFAGIPAVCVGYAAALAAGVARTWSRSDSYYYWACCHGCHDTHTIFLVGGGAVSVF
ncbi:MAG: hypothetical protein ABIR91_03440 [Candidatus Saccharimonadales bacterium]